MKRVLCLLFFVSGLSIMATPQQINKPLVALVPNSDIILIGVMVERKAPVLREKDAGMLNEPVPNTNTVITQLPRLGQALGCLYRVRVQEIAKQRGEAKRVRVGDIVNVFVPGRCFGALHTTDLPESKNVMLILSHSTLKADEYSDAVVFGQRGTTERYPRFDPKDCFVPTGKTGSVILVKEQADTVKQVKELLRIQ